jgi:hypothetical protein
MSQHRLLPGSASVVGGVSFKTTITPTLGAELVPTGNAASIAGEADATTGILASGAGITLSSVADPRTGSAGSYSINAELSVGNRYSYFGNIGSAGNWYLVDIWLKYTGGSGFYSIYSEGAVNFWPQGNANTASWVHFVAIFKYATSTGAFRVLGNTATAHHRFDDYSVKPLTFASCIATPRTTATGDVIASAMVSIPTGTRPLAGVMCNIDNPANIQNCVMLFIDGSQIHLHKIVAGVVTYVSVANITYVAGAPVQLRKSGTTYQMYYNGAQIGADQTIADATVVDNVNHAQFAVSPLATFGGFTLA